MPQQQGEKLQKVIAAHGVASRRKAEDLIAQGRVTVDGKPVLEPGLRVTDKQQITIDGKKLAPLPKMRYILLNKPAGWVTTVSDDKGRRTVMELLSAVDERVYPVGRLDYATGGLLLLTNDGELTNALLHPSKEVEKTYQVLLAAKLKKEDALKLRQGVELSDGLTAPAKLRIIKEKDQGSLVEVVIHEGRNRQIRRMFDAVGYEVVHLKRVGMAFLNLDGLTIGSYRELTPREVYRLKALVKE